jgi:hypothetical protein
MTGFSADASVGLGFGDSADWGLGFLGMRSIDGTSWII